MLFSRRAGSPNNRLALVIEIQSSLVRGSLALIGSGSTVLTTQSAEIGYQPDAPSTYYAKTALDAVKAMVGSLMQRLPAIAASRHGVPTQPSEAHFVLSSPWVISQAKSVTISFDKPTAMTPDRLHKILEDERIEAGFGKDTPSETIEEKVFDVKLDGYSIQAWKGKSATELEITYALSVGSADSIRKLRESVEHLVSAKSVFFHSALLLQYASLHGVQILGDTYMLVHAHGELTDLVIVRHGTCSFFGSYPIGTDTLIRRLATATHTDVTTAESLLSLYLGGHMESAAAARAGALIQSLSGEWSHELGKVAYVNGGTAVPADIFILAHTDEQLFKQSLEKAYPQSRVNVLDVDRMGAYVTAISGIGK